MDVTPRRVFGAALHSPLGCRGPAGAGRERAWCDWHGEGWPGSPGKPDVRLAPAAIDTSGVLSQRETVASANYLALRDMMQGSGCTARTVRYYVDQGILRATRTAGGHRLYAPRELDRLNFVIALREAGWSLDEVTEVLRIRDGATTDADACERLDGLVTAQISRLERKITVLERLRTDLTATRDVLAICRGCTERDRPVSCAECSKVPDPAPRGFRFTWLDAASPTALSTSEAEPFDEADAIAPGPEDL